MNATLFNTVSQSEQSSSVEVSAAAADIDRLRAHVSDLSIPYVEIRFTLRLQEIAKRWPLYTLNLATLCAQAAAPEAGAAPEAKTATTATEQKEAP